MLGMVKLIDLKIIDRCINVNSQTIRHISAISLPSHQYDMRRHQHHVYAALCRAYQPLHHAAKKSKNYCTYYYHRRGVRLLLICCAAGHHSMPYMCYALLFKAQGSVRKEYTKAQVFFTMTESIIKIPIQNKLSISSRINTKIPKALTIQKSCF